MDEYRLIRACQQGDRQAFNELISLYYPYVSGFLRKLTQNETLSDDLTQDTFVKLIRNIERYDLYGKAEFATYLITIAKHLYIDYLRRSRWEMTALDDLELPDQGFEESYLHELEFSEVLRRIETLPPNQAEAIKLKYLEGMTLAEIAERQHTEPKTIKSRIHIGKLKLRKALGKGGNDDG